jgi:hypothetical protein
MVYALIWIGVFALIALWSLAAWAMNGLGAWALANAGALGAPAAGFEAFALPAWLAPWLPTEVTQALAAMLAALTPAVEALLAQSPALASGLSLAAWVLWALGAGLLLLLGLGLSAMFKLLRSGAQRARLAAGTT